MAKSSFWDDLGNTLTRKAKGLSSRAENLYEIQKIRNKLSAQERMTEKLMMDIGKMIYTRYEQGEAVDGETGAICEEISQHMLEADHFRDAIAATFSQFRTGRKRPLPSLAVGVSAGDVASVRAAVEEV